MKTFYAYHVVTQRPMEVGQIIDTKNNKSGVYTRVMEKANAVNNVYNLTDTKCNIMLEHHLKVAMRELALEEVRQKHFPTYPSRLTSLYVSNTLEEAESWAYVFLNMGREVLQIVKLKVEGNKFVGDANNCFDATTNKEENLKLSFDYWENKPNKFGKPKISEILADGKIEVVEIIKQF